LGLGTGTFALSDDDYWSVRDAGRVLARRLAKSLRLQEPNLVHRVVERGSWGDHGHSGPHRSCRARSFGGRCACAYSRCDRTCSVDAADRASLSVTATDWSEEFDASFVRRAVRKIPVRQRGVPGRLSGKSDKDEFSVATKSDGRNSGQPIHWRASCGYVVRSYWFAQRDWKHSCFSTSLPRTMGTDILGLLACGGRRLLPKLRCLFRGLHSCLAN